MQQRQAGATIFHLQVAPAGGFFVKPAFLLLLGAKNLIFRIKRIENAPFQGVEMAVGRVAPFTSKIRVAPGCTRIVLQLLLATA
ncbi:MULTISPECIES: hypothetical protein [Pseudomonas]|uniref:hypothetical protein n=1 Tax=Pseudomonas TaxID=286 RepID=UPI00128C4DF1|nr:MULTISPECIES: hypothetical protein [Pseudomonas]MEB6591232.1 hypothetical protein [Pseudomonas asiatica]